MSQAERRQLLLQVDSHMTLRRAGDDVVLTISPGFADPIERVFVFRPRTPVTARHPKARLTPRQMALLCCWQDGQGLRDIAESWGVGRGTVRTISLTIRNLLGVDDLDTAVELVQDRLVRYRETLPLSGRCKQRPPADGSPLSEPLLAVLRLTADGRRPRLSGHRSSSGQRQEYGQSTDAPGRRPPRSREPARRRPEGPGNGAPPVRALVSHRDRPAVAFRSGRQRCGVLSSDQASGQPAISGWASSVCHATCSVPSPRPPCRTRASPNVEAARQRNRRPAPLHQGGEVLQHGPRRSPLSFRLRALGAEAA